MSLNRIKRFVYGYGTAAAGIVLSVVLVICIYSGIRKTVGERAMEGYYSDNAVYFRIRTEHELDLKEVGFTTITSVSFLDSDMESNKGAHIKSICFLSAPELPPCSTEREVDPEEWNSSKDNICLAGKELDVRENEGGKYYFDSDSMKVYSVIGRIGFEHIPTYLDGMLYTPFDGVIKPSERMSEYVAEGEDREKIEKEISDLRELSGVYIEIAEKRESGNILFSRQTLMLIISVSCGTGFVYLCYLWFRALEKEIYVLHLFGSANVCLILIKLLPMFISMNAAYIAGVLFVLFYEPYLGIIYMRLWMIGACAINAEFFLSFAAGIIILSRMKNSSQRIK